MDEPITRKWRNFRLRRDLPPEEELDLEEGEEEAIETFDPSVGTYFDSGAKLIGHLKLSGDFRIDSDFRGTLTTDGVVIVGVGGSIEGDIEARQVEIEGAVVGDVHARRMLIVRSTGRLHGDVTTACLEVERHAFFEGGTKMIRPLSNLQPLEASDQNREGLVSPPPR